MTGVSGALSWPPPTQPLIYQWRTGRRRSHISTLCFVLFPCPRGDRFYFPRFQCPRPCPLLQAVEAEGAAALTKDAAALKPGEEAASA